MAVPGSSITYARATYRTRYYRPIFGGKFILGLRGEIGALEPYGDTNVAPFYEHFILVELPQSEALELIL
ncbi:MAG: hypothetical protein CM1200mP12_08920 [Gammaproteobacteria bacterium]|nr:MAG: hypothetical protein CM1200mP12_08920 [Gammaproteobacteria bacterium]